MGCASSRSLSDATNSVPLFSFAGIHRVKVVDVYDGDTVKVVLYLNRSLVRIPVRLAGIDSPEMKPSRSAPHREEEKLAAICARDALRDRILNKVVRWECTGPDKYGRWLGTFFDSRGNVNTWMTAKGYAKPYDGGKKEEFAGTGEKPKKEAM